MQLPPAMLVSTGPIVPSMDFSNPKDSGGEVIRANICTVRLIVSVPQR